MGGGSTWIRNWNVPEGVRTGVPTSTWRQRRWPPAQRCLLQSLEGIKLINRSIQSNLYGASIAEISMPNKGLRRETC